MKSIKQKGNCLVDVNKFLSVRQALKYFNYDALVKPPLLETITMRKMFYFVFKFLLRDVGRHDTAVADDHTNSRPCVCS